MPIYQYSHGKERIEIKEKNIKIIKDTNKMIVWDEFSREWFDYSPTATVGYIVSQRKDNELKIAYVKLGSVRVAYSKTSPQQGIYVDRIALPTDECKIKWEGHNMIDKLIDCDINEQIKQEFEINIEDYL